jgi:mono/diheme cytochrome c family protein
VQPHKSRTVQSQDVPAVTSLVQVIVVVCFLTTGCARSGNDTVTESSHIEALARRNSAADPAAESQLRGQNVYSHYCAICHGNEGKGDGFNSTNLAVPPRNFSSPEFWRQLTDENLLLVVSRGGPAVGKSVLMPAWGRTLTDRQMHEVVLFLHTLAPRTEPQGNDSNHLDSR